ncbi:GNAT family N-acetyltransferase [Rheinheimera baltica]|uniref:GNAT family N-acetyltransferase n=1 Tax=Rheinheimera baltica TaxID=67576 RepID=A0ABT9I0Z2_9GAMM|nr:GNAT family N-acetyltransferase [Rheinheimera baltica]MDP5137064.1 GNAT family N-acetyltransferase [Rheinheimera baltica]MDP5142305.1 GNAT family N-acetyltransferase [Rheinheimera baltica]MDP5150797.1 GNAT family N-acetyltransferase [Rheinheimera baltica]MDP5188346.1 GNAT family N-acetyltransferase [Rheinheimera baltica]
MTTPEVQHQTAQQRFVLQLDSAEALLDYTLHGNNIDFHHTFVPPAFRGKGLAEQLVRHGLNWAKTQQYQIHASCWYVQKFLR